MNYFSKFPIVDHRGVLARNIMTRVKLEDTSTFFEATLTDDLARTDIISKRYYDSFDYDWLVKLSNKCIDPYFDFGLDSVDFERFIISKYGSLEDSQKRIVFWRNDWRSDDSRITSATFEGLTSEQQKYWSPVYNHRGAIIAYERAKEDWVTNTNKIQQLNVTSHTLVEGEVIKQGEKLATVASVTDTVILLEHVMQDFTTAAVEGIESITSATVIHTVIDGTVAAYWAPVDAYTYEAELNEAKKTIRLLDNRLKDQAEKQVKKLVES